MINFWRQYILMRSFVFKHWFPSSYNCYGQRMVQTLKKKEGGGRTVCQKSKKNKGIVQVPINSRIITLTNEQWSEKLHYYNCNSRTAGRYGKPTGAKIVSRLWNRFFQKRHLAIVYFLSFVKSVFFGHLRSLFYMY